MVRLSEAMIPGLILLLSVASGCAYNPTFGFPVEEGSIEAGMEAFVDLRCNGCHSVAGVPLPALAGAATPLFELGGATSRVKAYSELVTSIINPDHQISERYVEEVLRQRAAPSQSPMPAGYIEIMSVRQLIDLVAFLDSRYILVGGYEPILTENL